MLYLNGREVIFSNFPNGESCLNLSSLQIHQGESANYITFKYVTDADLIKPLFKDGILLRGTSLAEIRERIRTNS